MTQEEIIAIAKEIQKDYSNNVIKDIEFPPLVDKRTLKDVGIGVMFQLSTKFDYDMVIIGSWKKILGADNWYIRVRRNQLHLTFYIHFK